MCKMFIPLFVIVMLFNVLDGFCQNSVSIDSIETVEFSNEFLLNGKTGKLFIVGSNDSIKTVAVRWVNGYFAIGSIAKGKPFGKWYLFDKQNRHRKYLMFGFEAKCILYSKKMDKHGKLISEFKALTPCF